MSSTLKKFLTKRKAAIILNCEEKSMKSRPHRNTLSAAETIKANFPSLFKYDARSIQKNVYLYKILATGLAASNLFLSAYQTAFLVVEILLASYLALNIFLYVKPLTLSYKFYTKWSLYVDMLFISLIIIIRGGIRSDFFLGYILILQYLAYLPENKSILLTLVLICISYAISCILGANSLKLDWGRYIIRISFLIASYYILNYSMKQIKSADAIQKYAFDKVFRDTLTGTYNRNLYEEVFSGQTATHTGQCCVMLDIDNMKSINDTYGHQAGDRVLKTLGHIILSKIRESDVCIRYGGDEFFIHFSHISEKNCSRIMQRITSKVVSETIRVDTTAIHFTISYGLTAIPQGMSYEEAVAQADKRLYENKRKGKHFIE